MSVSDPATTLDPAPSATATDGNQPAPATTDKGTGGGDAGGNGGGDASTPNPDAGAKKDSGTTQQTGAPKPTAGEVLISEVMYNPSGTEPDTEWIEVYNTTSAPRALTGLTIRDGASRVHTIGGSVVLASKQYAVLARSTSSATAAKVPSSAIVYDYGAGMTPSTGVLLTNSTTGAVTLLDGSTTIASANYGTLFSGQTVTGKSVQLKVLTASGSQAASGWCVSPSTWVTGSDMGTPGGANNCP